MDDLNPTFPAFKVQAEFQQHCAMLSVPSVLTVVKDAYHGVRADLVLSADGLQRNDVLLEVRASRAIASAAQWDPRRRW